MKHESDVSNFSTNFTKEPVIDSVVNISALTESKEARFDDFTYIPPSELS